MRVNLKSQLKALKFLSVIINADLFLLIQVASTSLKSSEVRIYDIGYISSEPVDVSQRFSFHFMASQINIELKVYNICVNFARVKLS